MDKIKVTQTKGLITETEKMKKIVKSLGLGRVGRQKIHKDNNCIRGQINKVRHLVSYELISE